MSIFIWLGIVDVFQTFEELYSTKDKYGDLGIAGQLLDEDDTVQYDANGSSQALLVHLHIRIVLLSAIGALYLCAVEI